MKNLILSIGLLASLTAFSQGQRDPSQPGQPFGQVVVDTNPPAISGPVWEALTFGSGASTNWAFAPYATWSSSGDKSGGGLAALYKLNDFVVPMLRLDYYDGRVWMPSASVNLQAPITLYGKFTAIPFAFTGLATPLTGKGGDDGTAVGIVGAGIAVRLIEHLDLAYDVEKWSGFEQVQNRIGIVIKLGKW